MSKILIPLVVITVFFSGIAFFLKFFPKTPADFAKEQVTTAPTSVEFKTEKDFQKLLASYNQILTKTKADFAITFLDLKTREKIQISGEKQFHAASTLKPIVASYALKQVDEGKLSLNQNIAGLPLSERIRLMINISDNDSWKALLNFFGIAKIQEFSRSLGLFATNHFTNSSTTNDLALFLSKIYQGSILSSASQKLLLSQMQNTEREDRIPAGISQKKLVFHKGGTYGGEIHDIGIIDHPENPFILTIFSDGVNDLNTRPKILAEIAKVSWNFADGT